MKTALCLALASATLVLTACGGGDEPDATEQAASTDARGEGTPAITTKQRTDAAVRVATTDPSCTRLTPFYWEIGDKNGRLASGTGGAKGTAPSAGTQMPIGSASKWVFATYVVEKQKGVLSASDLKALTLQSGYTNFDACSASATVGSCLAEPGAAGGFNGQYVAANDGRFFYNGGHLQVLAAQKGLAADRAVALSTHLRAVIGPDAAMNYVFAQVPGGIATTPAVYAQFLRNLMNGRYRSMGPLLGSHAVCTHAGSDCPSAAYSPINQSMPGASNDLSDERWHYSLGHWVEDDPGLGDGAYSSPGAFGFYPWIDKARGTYGVLARHDTTPSHAAYRSLQCGRLIRKAWMAGSVKS